MARFSTKHLLGLSALIAVEATVIQLNPWSIVWQVLVVFALLSLASISFAFYCVIHATTGLLVDSQCEADHARGKSRHTRHSRSGANKERRLGDGAGSQWQG